MGDETLIHQTEWDLLEALWDLERATARDVTRAVEQERGWAYSTVKTLLDRMVKKGLVHTRRVGNVYEYRAAVQRADAARTAWQRFVDTAFGGATTPALRFLAKDARLSRRQREQLAALLVGEDDDA